MQESFLGILRPVDARTMWPHEAADFTPWLAHPENIQRLGDAIGLELEVEHTEVAVGPFAADILARETAPVPMWSLKISLTVQIMTTLESH